MSITLPSALDEPLFILGTTRAGTTLLSLMLGHHPNITSCGEYEWAFDFASDNPSASLGDIQRWLPTQRGFTFHQHTVDLALGRDDLFRSLLLRQYECAREQRPVAVAQVHRHYSHVLDLWPNARFVHILRDGRDVAASWMRFGWTGNGYVSGLEWEQSVAAWEALRPRIDPARRYEIRFEELLQEPERHLSAMCALVGRSYSDSMLRYHEDTTYAPLNRGESGKWRTSLSSLQIRLFEAAASRALQANHYPLSGLPALSVPPYLIRAVELDDRFRRQRVRLNTFGAPLWLADQVARRLPFGGMRTRVQQRMHDIINANLQ